MEACGFYVDAPTPPGGWQQFTGTAFACPQVTGIAAPGPYPLSAEGGPREPAGKSGTEVRGGKLAKLSWGFRLILRILFGRRFRWVKEHRAKRVLVKRVDSRCTTKFSI